LKPAASGRKTCKEAILPPGKWDFPAAKSLRARRTRRRARLHFAFCCGFALDRGKQGNDTGLSAQRLIKPRMN